jgi:hypothetical protein
MAQRSEFKIASVEMIFKTIEWILGPLFPRYIIERLYGLREDQRPSEQVLVSNDSVHTVIPLEDREVDRTISMLTKVLRSKENNVGLKRVLQAKLYRDLKKRLSTFEVEAERKRHLKVFF